MSYIEKSLGDHERIVERAHFHFLYKLTAWLALLVLGILLIGIWIFFKMMWVVWSTEIGVTNHRFIKKTGIFSLHTEEISLPNIEGAEVFQTFFGRIFNYGVLRVEGTGVDKIETPIIANPIGLRRAIESAKETVLSKG
ncbi:MAG TPA: PH domain-containing protein [Rhizomicrobium sp.]|nr:PH domain-containing protein [Rhizomicrobium sp.]